MKNNLTIFVLVFVFLFAGCSQQETGQYSTLTYPETAKTETTDTYFGSEVPDPYRWLEDDNSTETAEWVNAQNEVTFAYLANIPYRSKIQQRLTELEDYEKVTAPYEEGGKWYFMKNDGLQNQYVMYTMNEVGGEASVFLDPNKFSEDGTVSLSARSFNDDGSQFAYSISVSGSDWREIHVMDVTSKEKLEDKVEWVKFSGIDWYKDGFFYQGFDQPEEGSELKAENQFGKIYYHKIGTPQSEDVLFHDNPQNPQNRFGIDVTDDNRFIILYSSESTSGNELYFKQSANWNGDFTPIVTGFENEHSVIAVDGDAFLVETNLNAPNNRVVRVSNKNPSPENWKDVIPESENVLNASTAGGYIFASYLVDAKTMVKQYDYQGELIREVALPGIGTASGFWGEMEDEDLYFTFTSFTDPSSIYNYNLASGESTLYYRPELKFNPEDYETEQVFVESHDGTRVPMFIVYKKGIKKDGKNPTWLYSYGGFNISMRPSFSTQRILWLENGGIYAQPSIRGGGEYGEEWHKAGTKQEKKNVFEDFIASGKYLIENNYTSSDYLVIEGGSNGGLLVGATMNMSPDLAKVAFPRVGVMDMLRYQNFTIGRAWATDYGTAEDSKEMFEYLYSYSPLHNIKADVNYPATMVMTADHDDRVVPAHSFKYAATLQEMYNGPNPVLIRIETSAGHGGGTPTSKRIEQRADMYAFAFYNLGVIPDIARESM